MCYQLSAIEHPSFVLRCALFAFENFYVSKKVSIFDPFGLQNFVARFIEIGDSVSEEARFYCAYAPCDIDFAMSFGIIAKVFSD